MENIIKKAIEGGLYEKYLPEITINNDGLWINFTAGDNDRVLHQSDIILDPLFWQALGKSCVEKRRWRRDLRENGREGLPDTPAWLFHAKHFHEINLTEGWSKAVAYLEGLIK